MYLLETHVVSELRRARSGGADPGLLAWAEQVDPAALYLSVLTLQELELGIRLAEQRDPRQGRRLRQWLDQQVLPAFEGRILPVDGAVARCSAALQVPDPRPLRDALMAATALVHAMVLVTRHGSEALPTGVEVLNPWSGPCSGPWGETPEAPTPTRLRSASRQFSREGRGDPGSAAAGRAG